jgi:hypothetical protein
MRRIPWRGFPNETQSSDAVKQRRNDKRREDWSGIMKSEAQVKTGEEDEGGDEYEMEKQRNAKGDN